MGNKQGRKTSSKGGPPPSSPITPTSYISHYPSTHPSASFYPPLVSPSYPPIQHLPVQSWEPWKESKDINPEYLFSPILFQGTQFDKSSPTSTLQLIAKQHISNLKATSGESQGPWYSTPTDPSILNPTIEQVCLDHYTIPSELLELIFYNFNEYYSLASCQLVSQKWIKVAGSENVKFIVIQNSSHFKGDFKAELKLKLLRMDAKRSYLLKFYKAIPQDNHTQLRSLLDHEVEYGCWLSCPHASLLVEPGLLDWRKETNTFTSKEGGAISIMLLAAQHFSSKNCFREMANWILDHETRLFRQNKEQMNNRLAVYLPLDNMLPLDFQQSLGEKRWTLISALWCFPIAFENLDFFRVLVNDLQPPSIYDFQTIMSKLEGGQPRKFKFDACKLLHQKGFLQAVPKHTKEF